MIAHRTLEKLLACVALSALGACSWQEESTLPPAPDAAVVVQGYAGEVGVEAARIAYAQVGIPYRYGGATPAGFDCSGLVHYAYERAGKPVPRTTKALERATRRVDERTLEPGDILFFNVSGKLGHVGIYLDDGRFVHAPQTGRTVSVESLDSPFYRRAFARAGRFD